MYISSEDVENPNWFFKSVRDQCRSQSFRNLGIALGLFDQSVHMCIFPSVLDFNPMLYSCWHDN